MWDNLEGFSASFSLFYTADTWKRCEDLCFYIEKKKKKNESSNFKQNVQAGLHWILFFNIKNGRKLDFTKINLQHNTNV